MKSKKRKEKINGSRNILRFHLWSAQSNESPNEKGSVRSTAEMDSKLMALCRCPVVKDGTHRHIR